MFTIHYPAYPSDGGKFFLGNILVGRIDLRLNTKTKKQIFIIKFALKNRKNK